MNIVRRVLRDLKPGVVWDLGMATGHFSREATAAGALTIGFDADPLCVEKAYADARQRGETRFLPLVQDLLRPTPPSGWAEAELLGLSQRGRADLLLALGLTHHLAVRGGIPLSMQLEHYARLARTALVELVPESDPIVRGWSERLLVRGLTAETFEAAIAPHFALIEKVSLPSSERVLYLLKTT